LWRHHNAIVFEGVTPSSGSVIHKILAEAEVWRVVMDRWRVGE
jgi:hypothetical protein